MRPFSEAEVLQAHCEACNEDLARTKRIFNNAGVDWVQQGLENMAGAAKDISSSRIQDFIAEDYPLPSLFAAIFIPG